MGWKYRLIYLILHVSTLKVDIFIDEVRERIKVYYETKSEHEVVDKVSANIIKIVIEPSFAFPY